MPAKTPPLPRRGIVWAAVFAGVLIVGTTQAVDYERDIKPLLKERCVSCHGSMKQKGGLRLDAGALIVKGGKHPAIVAGAGARSELVSRVLSHDEDERMPPEGARLSEAQVAALRQWVDEGARFPQDEVIPRAPAEHWSFQPVCRPAVPEVEDKAWVRNPIDAFVKPHPQATPMALLRRVHLDVTGLPPTMEEQARFAKTGDFDAVITELLARPEYGERWARHWLDVVRYADTNGYERDAEKPFVWRYRDYVINALNEDKPFDRFILEQIAGDELPDGSAQSTIATGMLRLGHWDDEPADPAADRYDQLDDIVSTTGQAFLGLTIGCARCHDHKFEPLSTRDYYSLVAVFNPLERPRDGRKEQTVKVDGLEAYVWRESSNKLVDTHVLVRGSPTRPGELVQPAVPAILVKEQPLFANAGGKSRTTQRRLGLAQWIAGTSNPLTARVMVNRVWQQHFGQGLVTTANDFGLMGTAPSNPALLDWLAHWFMHDAQWSLKKLHRLILSSSTWQTAKATDSLQRYRRLEVEAIRDSMLAVSGRLNPKRFGPAMRPGIPAAALEANTDKEKVWKASAEPEASRRSIYAFIKRGLVVPMFETLDLADTVSSCPQRQVTTVAPQALSLFNGEFVNQQARHFAARLRREAGDDPARQIELAWGLALCRGPSATEQEAMLAFLQTEPLEQLCRVVLNLNEFVYPE
ncbi:MAG: PSD1 and planctomycete cytochrome C domain-containing protein [Prosthecobacter sp.]